MSSTASRTPPKEATASAANYVSQAPPSEATASAAIQQETLEIAHRKAIVRTPAVDSRRSSVALLLHGGCFTAGDHTWNAEQAASLTCNLNMIVVTFDFRQTCLQETMADLLECIAYLQQRYTKEKYSIGVIGCSSAGYYALQLAQQLSNLDYVIALCPVFDPGQRFAYLQDDQLCDASLSPAVRTKMQKQQLVYWQTEQNMIDAGQQLRRGKYKVPTLTIFGNSDANVPASMCVEFCEQIVQHDDHVAVMCLSGGHELCSKPSTVVEQDIAHFIV